MTSLILAETIKCARPLPGVCSPMYSRSFRTHRPVRVHRFTFQSIADALDPGATPETLLAGVAIERIPSGCQDEYALVANLGGEFHTVDEMAVEHMSTGIEETLVQLALTQVECADGEPALLDVFLIVLLTPEIAQSKRLRLTFSVQYRSPSAQVTMLDEAIGDCVVGLTGS